MDPLPSPAAASDVPDEQLWSWVDRDAPELDLHLEAHPEDRPRVDSIRRAIRAVAAGAPADRVPESIGGYQILRRIGSGGMGVVFEAEQARPKRRVAIKVIRGAWLDDEPTRRLFFREADVLGRLNHPGIAPIYEAGETKEGAPYFVMELVEGQPLDRWAEGRSLEKRLRVFEGICRAVNHAHEKGVVHRDLKPSNVLVEAGDRPRVLDFGLARIVDPDTSVSLTAAVTGRVVGTVRYMSPEQARGLASRATATSDVYSLGVLLYELITGRLPHDFEGTSLFEAARKVAEEEIPVPSEARGVSAPAVSADLGAALDAITMQALAKEPGKRYASAGALADDVRRALEGAPVEAAPHLRPGAAAKLEELGARAGRAIGRATQAAAASLAAATREMKSAANDESTRDSVREAKEGASRLGRSARVYAKREARRLAHGARDVAGKAKEAGAKTLASSTRVQESVSAAGARIGRSVNLAAHRTARAMLIAAAILAFVAFVNQRHWWPQFKSVFIESHPWGAVDVTTHYGRPAYLGAEPYGDFPRLAPWDDVRWQGETPVVHVHGEWYLLESIEGVEAGALIAAIQEAQPERWQAAFEADLFEHLYPFFVREERVGDVDRAVDLVLRRGPMAPAVELQNVPTNVRNHSAVVRR